jgi:hypothetical protein
MALERIAKHGANISVIVRAGWNGKIAPDQTLSTFVAAKR